MLYTCTDGWVIVASLGQECIYCGLNILGPSMNPSDDLLTTRMVLGGKAFGK